MGAAEGVCTYLIYMMPGIHDDLYCFYVLSKQSIHNQSCVLGEGGLTHDVAALQDTKTAQVYSDGPRLDTFLETLRYMMRSIKRATHTFTFGTLYFHRLNNSLSIGS